MLFSGANFTFILRLSQRYIVQLAGALRLRRPFVKSLQRHCPPVRRRITGERCGRVADNSLVAAGITRFIAVAAWRLVSMIEMTSDANDRLNTGLCASTEGAFTKVFLKNSLGIFLTKYLVK